MANWYGNARTNYVRVKDVEALRNFLDGFSIQIHVHPTHPDFVMLSPHDLSDSGGFEMSSYNEDDEEINLCWASDVAPHLCEGQVLIINEVGWEKLRYLSGSVGVVTWDGREEWMSLGKFAEEALGRLQVPQGSVAEPIYQNLPKALAAA